MRNGVRLAAALVFIFLAGCAAADAADPVRLEGPLTEGGLVFGQVQPGTAVALDGRKLRVSPEGRFIIGFGRDAPPSAQLQLIAADGGATVVALTITSRTYQVQRVNGLAEEMVNPAPEEQARIDREQREVAAARDRDTAEAWFQSGFVWPAHGPITGVYGSQRILNGTPRQPHYGVDIAAPEGSAVIAPADGVVTLAEPDLLLTGGTIVIDHGYGLSSTFLHLRRLAVAVGEKVRQGQTIGTIGRTGRATGAHLDWRMNWFDARIDPALVAGPMR